MDNLIDSAKDKIAELSVQASTLLNMDVLGSVKEYGLEKINEIWAQIEASTEVFQKTGYSITSIDINLAIPPTVMLSLDQSENIDDEAEQKLLEENKNKSVIYPILVALFKANAVQKSINSVQYKFTGLSIELGLSPKIDMKFSKIG